jgi:hypothetical protein
MFKDYQAVSIRHPARCCGAVQSLDSQRFLSSEAPDLPLSTCSTPGQCQCCYRILGDRRGDPQRDAGVGPPARALGANRRWWRGRRGAGTA